MSISNSMTRL